MAEDPSSTVLDCEAEGCGKQIALADACSMAIIYRMPGRGKSPYQCIHEQHFGCSHEHAVLALLQCLFDHIESGDHAEHIATSDHINRIKKIVRKEA